MRVLVSFFWWLPVKMMKSVITFLNLESVDWVGTERLGSRRRPLQTCGASVIGIAGKACTKVQDLDGALGSMAIRVISFMNWFLMPLASLVIVYSSYPFSALLSFIDDRILSFETKLETIFPPSACLFDTIDGMLCRAEILPQQMDEIIPLIMHQFPFLHWILARIISRLNSLLSNILNTHDHHITSQEKEISIDVNSNDIHMITTKSSSDQSPHATSTNNDTDIEFEPSSSKAAMTTCEVVVIQKSVDRLRFLRNGIKTLEEPHFADSPMYTWYHSANSSPVSDCTSEGENISPPFSRSAGKSEYCMNYSYKEMLERGHEKEVHQGKP